MEILWWLAPSLVVTVAAMLWVGWIGREGRGEVDREVAVQRLARAMERSADDDRTRRSAMPARPRDRSTGIAVRPTRTGDGAEQRPRRVS